MSLLLLSPTARFSRIIVHASQLSSSFTVFPRTFGGRAFSTRTLRKNSSSSQGDMVRGYLVAIETQKNNIQSLIEDKKILVEDKKILIEIQKNFNEAQNKCIQVLVDD
jgi:hypothetical protein